MICKNTLCDSATSSPLHKVKRGDTFLPDVDMLEIESLQTKNTGYKIRCILQVINLKKEGRTLRGISKVIGILKSTAYGRLQRVAISGFDRIRDNKVLAGPVACLMNRKNRWKMISLNTQQSVNFYVVHGLQRWLYVIL